MPTINERLDALQERHDLEDKAMPVPRFGTKNNMIAGNGAFFGQRFPVTLYAPSWVWLLREENIEALVSFLEDNEDTLSWGK
jgi:hypothetical protein